MDIVAPGCPQIRARAEGHLIYVSHLDPHEGVVTSGQIHPKRGTHSHAMIELTNTGRTLLAACEV